ncbi:MAG: SMC family ATPase [Bacteroidota bacterium]
MVPVSLRLRNFLSYGTDAEPLDFEQFHVACLSGGNGQGKSALLDAITWAVWGEARKSSDARKPDEDLLRIGTRDMQVELVFDLEGGRYRVVRSFQRSASGKTSKPGLEFQAWDGTDFRALTEGSVKDTQAVITDTLGLDYETFINSAFLLQGRSDEFTKKKSGERKEILGRILGLDRYEKYAAVARGRLSEATERGKRADLEIERLTGALEDEGRWKEEGAELESVIAKLKQDQADADTEGKRLTERLAELDSLAQTVEGQQARLARLAARRQELDRERTDLAGRITQAETLIAQRDAIERDYERWTALDKEYRDLSQKADLWRGVEKQLNEKKLELERQRMDHEKRLGKLDAEVQADRKAHAEAERRLLERPIAERGLDAARTAERELEALRARRTERQAFEARITALDKSLASERGALQASIRSLREQIKSASVHAQALPGLKQQASDLEQRVATVESVKAEQATVREQGSGVKAEIDGLQREIERLRGEVKRVDEKAERMRALDTETCPTCGTDLTPEHRRTVGQTYAEEKAALAAGIARVEGEVQQRQEQRAGLLRRFADLKARIEQQNGVADTLAAVQGRIATAEEAVADLAARRTRADDLDRQLRDDAFSPALRAERTDLEDRLRELPFDPERFEQVQAEAAQRARHEATLRDLGEVEGRRDTLAQKIEAGQREEAALREQLASGEAFAPVQRQIDALQQQLGTLGYDAARHDAVRRDRDALAEAPDRRSALLNARDRLADWTARRTQIADEVAQNDEDTGALRAAVEAAQSGLAARADLAEQQRTHTERRAGLATRLSDAQARLGGIRERLERAARDRDALKAVRAEHRDAMRDRTLYRHLRDAFGKNGIPALIIEETLPEIEDRANALLDRLAKGRTRVTLETLKDKKTGGTKETLDIKITDAGGVPRPYETFSGGEAFRVNFALRIALAQLLAERSGVRIRTLVVDEGFGTQDKQGIERLVEAIQAIREDFDKILVITHLDELKEAFPVRIEVKKDPVDGSGYDVIGV